MKEYHSKTINLREGTPEEKRKELLDYFEKTWETDEKLYTQLKSDDIFYNQGDPLRHVLLFYFGHTAVFYINKLFLAKIINSRVNYEFESIFAIGVDEMSWDDLNEKHYNWPSVADVRKYRNEVKKRITNIILNSPLMLPIEPDNPFWIIMMGIEHERIHIETSSVLIRQLPLNEVIPGKFGEICKSFGVAPQNEFLTVSGSEVKMGKPQNHPLYGWDNEYGYYVEKVENFKTTKYLVSNGEFLEFVNDNGYNTKTFWNEEGWNWCRYKDAQMPFFWRKNGNDYRLRLIAEEISMPWNWPVEVNQLEAKAFCNWKTAKEGKTFRLLTESEWYRLAEHCQIPDMPEWKNAPGNINLEHYASPCPVDIFESKGFYDVIGNVWQWTETPITGFVGFKVHPMYDDFSTPTFDGKHNLIKGGSWISTGNEATHHSRYAFRRHFYQHAGFRIVESETALLIHTDEYETDAEVAISCETNWGDLYSGKPNFHVQLANLIATKLKGYEIYNVLDLNAATGRLAFELSIYFDHITAIDFSARYIRMPIQLQDKGFMRYIVKNEGKLVLYREIVLAETGLEKNIEKIQFMQDNANNLKPIYFGYDLIIAPNLLEKMIDPVLFLETIHKRLNHKGFLVIASTYDWEGNALNIEHWPGGFKQDGEPFTSLDGLKNLLQKNFSLITDPENLQLEIPQSSRISELRLSEITIWQKK